MTRAAGYRACVDKSAVGVHGKRESKQQSMIIILFEPVKKKNKQLNKQIINKLYNNDNNAPINSKVQHPPGHLNFQDWIV